MVSFWCNNDFYYYVACLLGLWRFDNKLQNNQLKFKLFHYDLRDAKLHKIGWWTSNSFFFLENELKFRDLVTDDHFALPRTIGIIMADGRIRVLTHYSTSLSSLFRCIWKYRTSKKKSVLSIVIHTIYGVVCIQLTHFSCGDRENTRTLSYNHLPLLMVRPWNHVLYSTSFYALSSKMIRCKSFIKTYA